jgi:deazaflavin-dependent oxidoreductase (nitroreductase family)
MPRIDHGNARNSLDGRGVQPRSAAVPPRLLIKLWTRAHVILNRLSGGRAFNTMKGDEVCFVTMTGAVSNRRITIPLMYVPYREGVLLVASLGGAPKNPRWFGNLVKHPEIDVRYRTRTMRLTARLADAHEKPELWPICDTHYAPYANYRAQTSRDIPIFVCEPRG